jgi:hypothetical protein
MFGGQPHQPGDLADQLGYQLQCGEVFFGALGAAFGVVGCAALDAVVIPGGRPHRVGVERVGGQVIDAGKDVA